MMRALKQQCKLIRKTTFEKPLGTICFNLIASDSRNILLKIALKNTIPIIYLYIFSFLFIARKVNELFYDIFLFL